MKLFVQIPSLARYSALALAVGFGAAGCCPAKTVAETPKIVAPVDQDGDGVPDDDDRCPAVAGTAEFSGCPDSDGDGVPDDKDECAAVFGKAEFKGCPPPDRDGDGIVDAEDRCPDQAGPQETNGCPDRDGDGVADAVDKCPDQPGTKAEDGCLPKAMQKFSGSIKGIAFDVGRASIKRSSHRTLDEAAKVLAEHPELRLEIQGHTDDQGPDEDNLRLSQARADAVKEYLVAKGVAPERLDAKGYGESMPIADNKKAAGRAQNRRTEFRVLGSSRRNLNP